MTADGFFTIIIQYIVSESCVPKEMKLYGHMTDKVCFERSKPPVAERRRPVIPRARCNLHAVWNTPAPFPAGAICIKAARSMPVTRSGCVSAGMYACERAARAVCEATVETVMAASYHSELFNGRIKDTLDPGCMPHAAHRGFPI